MLTFLLAFNSWQWSRIEEMVIIAAACAPLLKVPIENKLYQLFGLRFYPATRDLNGLQTSSFELPSNKDDNCWSGGRGDGTVVVGSSYK